MPSLKSRPGGKQELRIYRRAGKVGGGELVRGLPNSIAYRSQKASEKNGGGVSSALVQTGERRMMGGRDNPAASMAVEGGP